MLSGDFEGWWLLIESWCLSQVELLEAIDKVGLDLVQVHGQVTNDLFENLPCASECAGRWKWACP